MENTGAYVKEIRACQGQPWDGRGRSILFDPYHPMAHLDTHRISFTYAPVVSMWVTALHSLFLYSDPPLPYHPPSNWLRLFLSQTFSHINTPTFSTLANLHSYPPMKMEQSVPKHWHTKFRHQGTTQKKAFNIQ